MRSRVVAKAPVREIRITEKAARAWNKERVRRDIGLLGVWKGALQIQFVRKRLVEMNKRVGRYLRQSEVGPIFMVIAHILGQQPLEVLLIQDDHVVEQVSSATSDPALRHAVLPGTAKGSAGGVASQVSHRRNHIRSEL